MPGSLDQNIPGMNVCNMLVLDREGYLYMEEIPFNCDCPDLFSTELCFF